MDGWHWLVSGISLVVLGSLAGRVIGPRRRASGTSDAAEVPKEDPYRVPMAVRVAAVPLGLGMLWWSVESFTSHQWRGVLDGLGKTGIATYCFYCAVRGRSVPWLESNEEAVRLVDRLIGQKSSGHDSSAGGQSSDKGNPSGTA